ncbi:MAG: molybdopterin molybdotransferase MoeA [Candidatus Bathyarchaeia archaeon]
MKRTNQKRTFKLTSYPDALARLYETFQKRSLDCEFVPIEKSMDRVLAEDIVANVEIPKTDIAVVDGYAIKSKDVAEASVGHSILLKVAGKLYPWSKPSDVELADGQAVYVTCGAPVPNGADAVIMVENTILHGEKIEIRNPVRRGENIAYAGEDVKRGNLLLKKGSILRPQDIGILAGLGIKEVKVFKKPRVAIIATGNELIELSREDPTRIVDNYALIISGLISKIGGEPARLGVAPDDLQETKKKIGEALENADVVVTIGGCSMGEKDFVPDAINALGPPGVLTHGIKVKPGKVTGFGMVKEKPVVMLPGLLASTMAGFYLILVPLIGLYTGVTMEHLLPTVSAKISQDLDPDMKHRHRFLPVRVKLVEGEFYAEIVSGSPSSLSRFLNSNGFILIPPKKGLKKNEKVNVTLFSKEEFSRFHG